MSASHGSCGGNRRRFLQTTAMAAGAGVMAGSGAGMGTATPLWAQAAAEDAVPKVTLGKTGAKVSVLGMGTSWPLTPSFVQTALMSGIGYIDTSESYENTVAEKVVGEVLERTKLRDKVFLVTKNAGFRKANGPGASKVFAERLAASLERLRTDYVDAYYIHGITGEQMPMLKDPSVKAAFEALKKQGKIKFVGISCHDPMLPQILELAAEVGWIDQAMIQYNFRKVDHDQLQRSIDKASKANLGLIAMKTQGGADNFPDKLADIMAKGFKKEVAAIKTVWLDQRMQVVVSEMTNRSDLRENIAASKAPMTVKEARLLDEYRKATAHLYCHGCGHLCESKAKGVPVATVMRYLRYYEVYGKRQQARALYQALPQVARQFVDTDLKLAEAACPHGLAVSDLIQIADRKLG